MEKKKPISASEEEELAEQRTCWAEDRTVLANERTFASWMRTGMACLGVALGLKAVFSATDYPLVAKGVAELFVLSALYIFIAAVRRTKSTSERMDTHDTEAQSNRTMKMTALALSAGALATGVILWLL